MIVTCKINYFMIIMINSLKENYCLLWDCIIWGPDIVWEWGSRSIPKEVIFKVGSEESVWVSQGITGGENATTESEKMSKYLEVGKSWKYSNWIVRMEIEEWAWRGRLGSYYVRSYIYRSWNTFWSIRLELGKVDMLLLLAYKY